MSDTYPKNLSAYAVFAALLASAGLPIYIHAPKFYVDEYGVSLAALGTVLFGLRLLDVVQDPLFGRLSERLRNRRELSVLIGCAMMALSMFGLFAVQPLLPPLIWFALMLTGVFSGFSFLTINFYAQGVVKAERLSGSGHLILARWRETGALLGVCIAAIAPVMLSGFLGAPFVGFAIGFAVLSFAAVLMMRGEWVSDGLPLSVGFRAVLRDPLARRLLLIALVNAAPVAVSSTLFLFFVESRLLAPGFEGLLLLLFFLSAAVAAPVLGKFGRTVWGQASIAVSHDPGHPRFWRSFDAGVGRLGVIFCDLCLVWRHAWGGLDNFTCSFCHAYGADQSVCCRRVWAVVFCFEIHIGLCCDFAVARSGAGRF